MITIALLDGRTWTRYRVAGVDVAVDVPLHHLAPFRAGEGSRAPAAGELPAPPDASPLELVFEGAGRFGGGSRQVRCEAGDGRYLLRVEGGERFAIGRAGILRLGRRDAAVDDAVAHAVLGPGLVLALARRGIFCLHASAVRGPGGAVLLSGRSGAGKSTLARFLHERTPRPWTRLSDDVTPVSVGADGAVAWPRFPQLALDGTGEGGSIAVPAAPERLPLGAFCGIADRESADVGAPGSARIPVSLARMEATAATAAIVQSTLALALFARDELAALLELASTLAVTIPVTRLERVRGLEHLPAIAEALRSELEEAPLP